MDRIGIDENRKIKGLGSRQEAVIAGIFEIAMRILAGRHMVDLLFMILYHLL